MEEEETVKPKRKYTRKAVTQSEPVPPPEKPKKESVRKPKAKSFLESLADRDFSQVEVLPIQKSQPIKSQPVITRKLVAPKERPVAEVEKEVFTEDLEEENFEMGEKEALVQDFYRPKHVSPEIQHEQVQLEVVKAVRAEDQGIYEPEEVEMAEEEILEEVPVVRPQTFHKPALQPETTYKPVSTPKVKNSEEALNFNFKFSFNYKKYTKILLGLLILGLISWLLYYFIFSKTPDPLENLQKIVILPSETPVIYVISENADVLKNPVFAQARAGDRVFVFEKSALMVIFRESEDKIVDMVRFSGEQAQAQTNPQPTTATTTESTVAKPKVTATSTASTTATTTPKTKKTN